MASGTYRERQPTEPSPHTPPNVPVPARTTRKIAVAPPARASKTIEPETRIESAPRVQYTPLRGTTALKEPAYEETRPRFLREQLSPLTSAHPWMPRLLLTLVCVVIGAFVLIIAGIYVRQPGAAVVNYPQGQSFPIELGGSYAAFNTWNNSSGPLPAETPLPKNPGPYSVLGKPTISVNLINQVLSSYHSPTAGMGQTLYDLGVQYGIDPVYPLAFFMHESLFGTTGEARVTLSLGNERCIPDRSCIDQDRGGYAKMNSWQDGFEHWYKLIRNLYVAQWGRVTVDQIIPKYAPNSDGNNEKAYIATLKHEVDVWRAGGIRP